MNFREFLMCIRTLLVSTDIPKTPSPQRNMQLKSWSACPEPFGAVGRAACTFYRVATAIHCQLTTGFTDLTTLEAKYRSELWEMCCYLTALFPTVVVTTCVLFVRLVVNELLPAMIRICLRATTILWFFLNAGVVLWLIWAVCFRYVSLVMRGNINRSNELYTEIVMTIVACLAIVFSMEVSDYVVQTVIHVCLIVKLLFKAASIVLYVVAGVTIVGILYLTITSCWYDILKDSLLFPVQNPSEVVQLAAVTATNSSVGRRDALDAAEGGLDNVQNSSGSVEESSVVSAAEENITDVPVEPLILGTVGGHFNWTVDEESSAVSDAEMPQQNVLVKSFILGGHFSSSPDEEPPALSDEQVELIEMPEQNILVEKPRLHLGGHIHSTDDPAASAELDSVGCTTAQSVEPTEGLLAESQANSSLDPVSDLNGLDSADATVWNVGRTKGLRKPWTNSSTSSSWESLIDDVDEMMMTSPEYSTVYQPDNKDCTKLPRDGPNPCCEVEDQFVDVTYNGMAMHKNPQ